jgi:pyrroloquinoline-quinone synthase
MVESESKDKRRELWDAEEFERRLRQVGAKRYHSLHPFNIAMNNGRLTPDQLQCWVRNRFLYQTLIPRKDAAIISKCPIRDIRRQWVRRIIDHDGTPDGGGGIESWLRLGEALGVDRDELLEHRNTQPAAKFAVEAYLHFVQDEPWPIGIASSLTEMFAPDHMRDRVAGMEQHYPWIPSWGFDYFRERFTRAARDAGEALPITIQYCNTPELQDRAIYALQVKCDILWALLDAIQGAEPE